MIFWLSIIILALVNISIVATTIMVYTVNTDLIHTVDFLYLSSAFLLIFILTSFMLSFKAFWRKRRNEIKLLNYVLLYISLQLIITICSALIKFTNIVPIHDAVAELLLVACVPLTLLNIVALLVVVISVNVFPKLNKRVVLITHLTNFKTSSSLTASVISNYINYYKSKDLTKIRELESMYGKELKSIEELVRLQDMLTDEEVIASAKDIDARIKSIWEDTSKEVVM